MSSSPSATPAIVQSGNPALIFDDPELNRPRMLTVKTQRETAIERSLELCLQRKLRDREIGIGERPLHPATLPIPSFIHRSPTTAPQANRAKEDALNFAKQWGALSDGRYVLTSQELSESANMSHVRSQSDGKAIDESSALGMLAYAPESNGVPCRQISTTHFGVPPGGRTVPGIGGGTASSSYSTRDGAPSTSERRGERRSGAASSSRRSSSEEWEVVAVTVRLRNKTVDGVNFKERKLTVKK